MTTAAAEWTAWLHLDGWAGRSKQAVVVVRETAKRYEIRPASSERVKLGGRYRWLSPGQTALVPKRAITKRQQGEHVMAQTPNEERMSKIAERFPSLRGQPGVRPWNADRLAKATAGRSHGEQLAARFVLGVWTGGCWPWDGLDATDAPLGRDDEGRPIRLRRFDLFEAKGVWDDAHERAFKAWIVEDWRFCP